jgi:membrane-bound lytic murein transglycosylase F
MHWIKRLSLLVACFFVASCGDVGSRLPLPFPTPAQHDLVVLAKSGPLTLTHDDGGNAVGLERDLVEAFAQELGVGVSYIETTPEDADKQLLSEQYHIAIGWFSPDEQKAISRTVPIFETRDILAQHEASLPITQAADLAGKTLHVMAGSRQEASARRLAKEIPGLTVKVVSKGNILDLLESLGSRGVNYVLIDDTFEGIANQYVPSLRTTLKLGDAQPIVWLLGPHPNVELAERLKTYLEKVQRDGTLARLEDRYYGHVLRLTQADVIKFLADIETVLPKLRKLFQAAETVTGLDWRLIAAIAYQESHWDSFATSPTNVRGIMMLTEETADRLRVTNRLDPKEAILAGARYVGWLKEQVDPQTNEPDRTWLALAAYNLGPGHFNAGQRLAKQLGADPAAWYDMKRVLPKLSQAKYAQQLKTGRARGGEAVILVENIRSYYDILLRNTSPFNPTPAVSESIKRLVAEVDQLQKNYVRKITLAQATTIGDGDAHEPGLKLPNLSNETIGESDRDSE